MVVILVGNKSDLGHSRQVNEEEGKNLAEAECLCFMETSALENLNVEESFLQMITKIHDITIQRSLEAKTNEISTSLGTGKEIISIDEVTATKQSSCCSY
jgi:Rab family protein